MSAGGPQDDASTNRHWSGGAVDGRRGCVRRAGGGRCGPCGRDRAPAPAGADRGRRGRPRRIAGWAGSSSTSRRGERWRAHVVSAGRFDHHGRRSDGIGPCARSGHRWAMSRVHAGRASSREPVLYARGVTTGDQSAQQTSPPRGTARPSAKKANSSTAKDARTSTSKAGAPKKRAPRAATPKREAEVLERLNKLAEPEPLDEALVAMPIALPAIVEADPSFPMPAPSPQQL